MTKEEKRDTLRLFAGFPKSVRMALCAGEALAQVKHAAQQEKSASISAGRAHAQ